MPAPSLVPPPADAALGVGFYLTSTPPVVGTIKETPADFEVREISLYPMPASNGPFTVLRVRSENWEQHELAERLARRFGLPPRALAWAGTKDRRARSERLFSYRGAPPASSAAVLPGVELLEAYRARDGLVLGHHFGNSFSIRITGIDDPASTRLEMEETHRALRDARGFPNWFGPQRFGEVRPVTHLVGQALVKGDVAEAVERYLAWVPASPSEGEGDAARLAYRASHDTRQALRDFPPTFRFERQLLDHLSRGQTAERALRALSHPLRSLFVHAYQSWLFNRWLTARHAAGMSLTVPEPGDHLLRVARDGTVPGIEPVPVTADNLAECRDLASRGRALLSGPLVGFETPVLEGAAGALFERLLEEEGVQRASFQLRASPELASRGAWRPAVTPLPPVAIVAAPPENGGSAAVRFHFSLPKGAYATMLLREFLKSGAQSNGRF